MAAAIACWPRTALVDFIHARLHDRIGRVADLGLCVGRAGAGVRPRVGIALLIDTAHGDGPRGRGFRGAGAAVGLSLGIAGLLRTGLLRAGDGRAVGLGLVGQGGGDLGVESGDAIVLADIRGFELRVESLDDLVDQRLHRLILELLLKLLINLAGNRGRARAGGGRRRGVRRVGGRRGTGAGRGAGGNLGHRLGGGGVLSGRFVDLVGHGRLGVLGRGCQLRGRCGCLVGGGLGRLRIALAGGVGSGFQIGRRVV